MCVRVDSYGKRVFQCMLLHEHSFCMSHSLDVPSSKVSVSEPLSGEVVHSPGDLPSHHHEILSA